MNIWWETLGSSWWIYGQMVLTIAMAIHVHRSGAEMYWFYIVIFLQPVGAWIYFFAVFVRGFFQGHSISSEPWWQRKLSLDELRYRAERAPTVNNRIAYAEGLMAHRRHAEAVPLLEAVIAADQIHCQAMHDLALCHLACDEPVKAIALIKRLMQRDYRWSNYRAWHTLIDAHMANKDAPEALNACRELAKMVPTLENKCFLAEHLLANRQKSEVIVLLDHALEDYSYLPFGKRLKNWRWARYARRLLNEAETQA